VARIILGVIALIGVISWGWLKSVEARRWSRMERRVVELRQDAEARHGIRPVLRGTPVPGNAWDDYLKALEIMKGLPEQSGISLFASRTPSSDRGKAVATLAQLGSAVDFLQAGTRRTECKRARISDGEPRFELGGDTQTGRAMNLSVLAVCRARLLQDEGKIHEAVELLLDICHFAQDFGNDGSLNSGYTGAIAFNYSILELKELLCSGRASPEHLRQLDRELELIDASLPRSGTALRGELESFGELLLNGQFIRSFAIKPGTSLHPYDRPSWRHAFSSRLMMTSAFDQADAWMARLQDADLGSRIEERRVWNEYTQEIRTSENLYNGLFSSILTNTASDARREWRTRLRLIRTAVHYYATNEILELEDPFGSKLLHAEGSDRLKIWGVGLNGKDDGGKGEWPNIVLSDIVLEVPRRP
jgi:hypothetical protein